jgi:hypothetical protein
VAFAAVGFGRPPFPLFKKLLFFGREANNLFFVAERFGEGIL